IPLWERALAPGSHNDFVFFFHRERRILFSKKRLRPQACFDGNRRFAAALSRRYGGFKAAGVPRHHRSVDRGSAENF
ncbi:MAG: hypothetical protein SO100_04895, partial [Dysosmobacter sp.]|nr:hypothetical protein [Dysosmobacter sp.]